MRFYLFKALIVLGEWGADVVASVVTAMALIGGANSSAAVLKALRMSFLPIMKVLSSFYTQPLLLFY